MSDLSRSMAAFPYWASACAIVAISLCRPVGARGQKPPTLDPTYGMSLPTRARSGPEAQWIWSSQVKEQQTIFLRARLDLKDVPKSATLYITADNFFTLYVNGARLYSTDPNSNDGSLWRNVHGLDIAPHLKAGKNVIAVSAVNADHEAGVVARLEIAGKPVLLTNGAWRVSEDTSLPENWTTGDYDDTQWTPATVIGPLSDPTWSGELMGWPNDNNDCPYLFHKPIRPVAILDVKPGKGRLEGLPTLTKSGPAKLVANLAPDDSNEQPSFVLDFGLELTGRVIVTSIGPAMVLVGTGESFDEAVEAPWGGVHALALDTGRKQATPYSAFRYARVSFAPCPGGEKSQTISGITLDHLYYPVEYKGSFSCSDPLLTRIWYTGACTAHLCMQEEIWDAPKRDRMPWMGDMHISGEVINNVFADKFLMEKTMQSLRNGAQGKHPPTDPPRKHVNNIPGYSCAWIAGLADFHRHLGDYEYLKKQHDLLISMIEFLRGELEDRGVFANNRKGWMFCDWAPDLDGDTPLARATTHLFLVKGVKEAAFLLSEMGDEAAAGKCSEWADELTAAARKCLVDPTTNTYGDRRQENAMAIYSGVAVQPQQVQAIYDNILIWGSPAWDKVATPYYNNYVIYAMSLAGHTGETLEVLRKYWGGMLAQGATTWWEGYDLKWEKTKWHAHLEADNKVGYQASLCHGWSAGPTNWLTERILGIRPTAGGFRTADIEPDLGDLSWAEGDVPTPNGILHVRAENTKAGLRLTIALPAGVDATVGVPGTKVSVNGRAADPIRSDNGRVYIRLNSGGNYTVIGS